MTNYGNWRVNGSAILSDEPVGWTDATNVEAYGGYLICESVGREDVRRLISAAPKLLAACEAVYAFDWKSGAGAYDLYELLRTVIAEVKGSDDPVPFVVTGSSQ